MCTKFELFLRMTSELVVSSHYQGFQVLPLSDCPTKMFIKRDLRQEK